MRVGCDNVVCFGVECVCCFLVVLGRVTFLGESVIVVYVALLVLIVFVGSLCCIWVLVWVKGGDIIVGCVSCGEPVVLLYYLLLLWSVFSCQNSGLTWLTNRTD